MFPKFVKDKKTIRGNFPFLEQDTRGVPLHIKISQNFQGYCWFNAVSQVFLFWFFKSQLSKLHKNDSKTKTRNFMKGSCATFWFYWKKQIFKVKR